MPLAETVPTAGLNDQTTPVFVVPVIVATKVTVCAAFKVAVAGANETLTGAFTVRLSCLDPLPNALVAVTVKVAVPAAVGVPAMTPVELFKVSPAGSEPPVTAHVIGVLPEALSVCE